MRSHLQIAFPAIATNVNWVKEPSLCEQIYSCGELLFLYSLVLLNTLRTWAHSSQFLSYYS